jgi:sulfide:quinone oxidoreductase
MARIIVIGAGVGGLPAAYDLRKELGPGHEITVVSANDRFQFTPSNPWVAVGWRKPEQVMVSMAQPLARKGIRLVAEAAARIDAAARQVVLASGDALGYDYLIIATGPKLAFDEVPGLGRRRPLPVGLHHAACGAGLGRLPALPGGSGPGGHRRGAGRELLRTRL